MATCNSDELDHKPFGTTTKLNDSEFSDSDFEDNLKRKVENDTSAQEARNGKDIQGITWEGFKYTRDEYRGNRLNQYENFFNILTPRSRGTLDKEHLQVEEGSNFYDFQSNTRLVISTIVHFQLRGRLHTSPKCEAFMLGTLKTKGNNKDFQLLITTALIPDLNDQLILFGRVLKGEDVVQEIEEVDTDEHYQPKSPIGIISIILKREL